MTHDIFQACVDILLWMGSCVGLSYEAINVWLFCFLLPLFMLIWAAVTWQLWVSLKKKSNEASVRCYLAMLLVTHIRNFKHGSAASLAVLQVAADLVEKELPPEDRSHAKLLMKEVTDAYQIHTP